MPDAAGDDTGAFLLCIHNSALTDYKILIKQCVQRQHKLLAAVHNTTTKNKGQMSHSLLQGAITHIPIKFYQFLDSSFFSIIACTHTHTPTHGEIGLKTIHCSATSLVLKIKIKNALYTCLITYI